MHQDYDDIERESIEGINVGWQFYADDYYQTLIVEPAPVPEPDLSAYETHAFGLGFWLVIGLVAGFIVIDWFLYWKRLGSMSERLKYFGKRHWWFKWSVAAAMVVGWLHFFNDLFWK